MYHFQKKLSEFCNSLDQFLPRDCFYKIPKCGYYIWLELSKGKSVAKVIKNQVKIFIILS